MSLPFLNFFRSAGRLPVDIAIAFMLFALILGSDYAFAEKAPFMKDVLYMYLFMFLVGRVTLKKVDKRQFPLSKAIWNFAALFVVTAVVMLFLPQGVTAYLAAGSFDAQVVFAATFGVMYAFIKAWIEEDIFRNRLVNYVGERGQAIAFGLFHFFILVLVIGFSWMLLPPILILMGLGFAWGRIQNRYGTIGASGSHTAYNLAILGILPKVLGAVV